VAAGVVEGCALGSALGVDPGATVVGADGWALGCVLGTKVGTVAAGVVEGCALGSALGVDPGDTVLRLSGEGTKDGGLLGAVIGVVDG
jgi:hypothetical protein